MKSGSWASDFLENALLVPTGQAMELATKGSYFQLPFAGIIQII